MNTNVKGFTNRSKINEEAAQWVLLLEETPNLSSRQVKDLNAWVATSDIHRDCIKSMAESWGEMELLTQVMAPQETRKPSFSTRMLVVMFYPVIALFAVLSITIKQSKYLLRPVVFTPVALCAVMYFGVNNFQSENNSTNLVLSTEIGENIRHDLPDGSSLWLNSSSKVQINYSDDYRRVHLLSGEAHFEVAKNAKRPFEVYADDRLVRAIGTAFTVHKLDGNIEVLVSEGTVELAIVDNTLLVTPDDAKPVMITENVEGNLMLNNKPTKVKKTLGQLTAGQRISIPVKDDNLSDIDELDTGDVTRFLSWKDGKLVFAGESLEEVIKEITRHTQVKIDVIDPQLKTMRIGGQFQVGETDALFYVLESGFGINVKRLDDNHVQLLVKDK